MSHDELAAQILADVQRRADEEAAWNAYVGYIPLNTYQMRIGKALAKVPENGLTSVELSQRLHIPHVKVAYGLKQLEEKGLVERFAPSSSDVARFRVIDAGKMRDQIKRNLQRRVDEVKRLSKTLNLKPPTKTP